MPPRLLKNPAVLYLHGFNSSPQSQKLVELGGLLPELNPDVELVTPLLGFDPKQAYRRACEAYEAVSGRCAGVVGSSLGGYYATALSQRFGLKAVLINPAVYPYELLRSHLGPQHNPYTGERYVLTERHMADLRALDPGPLKHPKQLLLLLQSGDETLDFRQAIRRYPDSPAWIQPGGDHRFQRFDRVVPAMLEFLGVSCHTRTIG
ncbi:YqiA/YcfP family alpha/beta fold hydrolase [Marinobacter caseinilyticus]|uniref:YqiA/YcfP family alpha/beta fold hydrolase n=1 Tax=Marinobacter caseinilyticus TaxID=2692195 RepID=UPI001407A207|nr:YqiA/YcfP family alpha/beta fold hydrolase [Marinobacter caseinilyticus]